MHFAFLSISEFNSKHNWLFCLRSIKFIKVNSSLHPSLINIIVLVIEILVFPRGICK